jgi:DnaK suppressor protein
MRLEKTLMPAIARKKIVAEDYRPSENEPFMSERQRAYFRRKLLAWRDEILRSTKETLQHLHDDSAQHPDIATRQD